MYRWLTGGLTAAAVTAAATATVTIPTIASASAQPNHGCSVNLTAKFVGIEVITGKPPESGSNTGAAIVDGTVCGKPFHGAMRDITHFPALGQFNGTST